MDPKRCISEVSYGTLGEEWRHGDPGGSSYITRCGRSADYAGLLCRECNEYEIGEFGRFIAHT